MGRKSKSNGRFLTSSVPRDPSTMPFVKVAPGGRYFMTEDERPFLVIGHNEAISWPGMHQMRREKDLPATEAYIKMLADHGVNTIRLMLEYCSNRQWYFENPVGNFLPGSIQYWDNLIGLCERYRVRVLLTPWDTFFMARKWADHPYNLPNSGFDGPGSFCLSPTARLVQKDRLRFIIDRWGDSPAIFAYDLLNEIHDYWGGTPQDQFDWVTDMARYVKEYELARWGKRHLLTVSIFGSKPEGGYADLIMRHPELDFASTHAYMLGHVDNPNNTVDCAISMQASVLYAFDQITSKRPYTDSENGPIHMFMDLKRQLPDAVDDEYYHNMAWAHLATGGAGSGMRWPFRHPHTLTQGMHEVQLAMSRFLPDLDWLNFSPCPVNKDLKVSIEKDGSKITSRKKLPVLPFGCADETQALIWLLRDLRKVSLQEVLPPARLSLPPLEPGNYRAEFWNTYQGRIESESNITVENAAPAWLSLPPFEHDLAISLRKLP